MSALFCLSTFLIGLFKQDVQILAISSAFAIAYSIELMSRNK